MNSLNTSSVVSLRTHDPKDASALTGEQDRVRLLGRPVGEQARAEKGCRVGGRGKLLRVQV